MTAKRRLEVEREVKRPSIESNRGSDGMCNRACAVVDTRQRPCHAPPGDTAPTGDTNPRGAIVGVRAYSSDAYCRL
jgi:hypothetical protein